MLGLRCVLAAPHTPNSWHRSRAVQGFHYSLFSASDAAATSCNVQYSRLYFVPSIRRGGFGSFTAERGQILSEQKNKPKTRVSPHL
ncbi:hypothetical protein AX14_011413 [Amanita brunnescens Koide BX004]|nr:hypothetical protein AX14_011413 [Amanita brunnescens Koide BX004]